MNHKPLILLFIFFIITYLLIRKEKYENEEEIGEVEVPPGLNISDFLQKLELMKDEKKKNEETLDALYGINRDANQDSSEQASEAIQDENETQYAFLKDFVDGAQQTEQEIRDDARTQVNTQLEDIVTKQAEDYFSTKDTGFDDVPKKKGIARVDNISFDSFSAGLASALDITTYGGTNVYGDGNKFYTAIVPRCHKRPMLSGGHTIYDGGTSATPASRAYAQRVYDLSQPKWSCLNSDGVPGDVGEDGFVVDSFEQCASKCLTNDKCSGFSVVPDSTFPDEGFGLTCKLTHHEFEDSKEVPASTNEQVFAVHENDYLKNPLYIDLFTARWGANGPYAARNGSDNHAIRGDPCHWRSACDYHQPWGCALSKVFPDFARDFKSTACQNGVKIENNGIPRDCEGKMVFVDYAGTEHNTTDKKFLNRVCETGEEYSIKFKRTLGGKDAINGGTCLEGFEENNLKCEQNSTIVEAPEITVPGACPSGYDNVKGECKKPGPCNTSGRGGTCPASLGHGDLCFSACPPGKEIAHDPADALYCKYGELSGSGNSCRDPLPECSWRQTNCRNMSYGTVCEWTCPQECRDIGGCT